MYYGFEYFCGANIVVEVEGVPILEAVGISYMEEESKKPIYGYSSRFFDTMARGQCLVVGQIVVNYVHSDYLTTAIDRSEQLTGGSGFGDLRTGDPSFNGGFNPTSELADITSTEEGAERALDTMLSTSGTDVAKLQQQMSAMKTLWENEDIRNTVKSRTRNPHDRPDGLSVKISFGDRTSANGYSGKTGARLSSVHFRGRGTQIEIDEHTIVESYPFIARRIHTLQPKNVLTTATIENDDFTATTSSDSSKIPTDIRNTRT